MEARAFYFPQWLNTEAMLSSTCLLYVPTASRIQLGSQTLEVRAQHHIFSVALGESKQAWSACIQVYRKRTSTPRRYRSCRSNQSQTGLPDAL